ncbi:hypothetical protein C8J57DRAFT_1518704 [Mycena rebaudengoi]|nr:hypothetical protein C8J57DRAFT_1518704 [Mycena rebaudengoi]
MAEFALISIDKRKVVDSSDAGGYGWKVTTGPPPLRRLLLAQGAAKQHLAASRSGIGQEIASSSSTNTPVVRKTTSPQVSLRNILIPKRTTFLSSRCRTYVKHVALAGYKHQGDKDNLFPANTVYVARNLTKKWYVRSDVLVKAAHRRGPDISGGVHLELGEHAPAILAEILSGLDVEPFASGLPTATLAGTSDLTPNKVSQPYHDQIHLTSEIHLPSHTVIKLQER